MLRFCILIVGLSISMDGWAQERNQVYGFLGLGNLESGARYSTDWELLGGLGYARQFRSHHGFLVEGAFGPNFEDNRSSNTFSGWDLSWRSLDVIYTYHLGKFFGGAGLGFSQLKQTYKGTIDFEFQEQERSDRGVSLSLRMGYRIGQRITLRANYKHFASSFEALPMIENAFFRGEGKPELFEVGIQLRLH